MNGKLDLRALLAGRLALFQETGWVTGSFFGLQAMRLGLNVALARILAPEMLGVMLIINTLRTGGELLTDVGIAPSIIRHPHGDQPYFFNTAWTLQILRGFILLILALMITLPVARLYDNPLLVTLIPLSASVFVISGFTSPGRFLAQRWVKVRTLAYYELGTTLAFTVLQIAVAIYTPTVWALVWGLILGNVINVGASFLLMDWRVLRLQLDRSAMREILHFGKWIFASSIIFFLAMNFDRLYFADVVPMAILGVYGIARTFADIAVTLFQRIGSLLIMPKVSAISRRGDDVRKTIAPLRMAVLLLVAAGLAAGIAIADELIYFLYDDRYRAAALFLPIMLIGAWFAILAAFGEAIMMGIGRPASIAGANALKLALVAIAVPLLLPRYGILLALVIFALGEVVRYIMLAFRKRAAGLGFLRQDIAATALFLTLALVFREFTMMVGLTDGIEGWIAAGTAFHG